MRKDIEFPPFGESFTIPTSSGKEMVEWIRDNCVVVTRDSWERMRRTEQLMREWIACVPIRNAGKETDRA